MGGKNNMKKLMMFSLVIVTGLALNTSAVFAQSSSTQAEVKKAANPWSLTGIVELSRTVLDKPADAFSNGTTILLGRKVSKDVTLKLYVPVSNTFKAKEDATYLDKYFTLIDPVLAVAKSNLAELAGWKASGDLRVYLPLTEGSRNFHSDLFIFMRSFDCDISFFLNRLIRIHENI